MISSESHGAWSGSTKPAWLRVPPAAISFAILLGAWEFAVRAGWISDFLFPPPSSLVAAITELGTRGFPDGISLWRHVSVTLARIGAGFSIACATAIPLGIVFGMSPILDRLTHPVITFGRSLAAISVLPLFIAWFGIGELSKIMLLALAAFWVLVTYTIAGVKFVDPVLIRAARSMDATDRTVLLRVVLPAALPRIFTGLKVALAVCFMVIVAAEMIATVEGLGALIKEARNAFRTDITIVGMLVIGALGGATSLMLDALERRLLPWQRASGESS